MADCLFKVIDGKIHMRLLLLCPEGLGPNGASNTFSIYTIDTAFKYNNFGMASSMAVIMIFMIVCVQIAQRFITNRLRRRDQHGA